MGFIQRELDRLAIEMKAPVNSEKFGQLYAAQQALSWALEPSNLAAPCEVIRSGRASRISGTPEGSEGCLAHHHPPQS